MRKNLLAKRILCSVLAASVFGVTGSVFAADLEIIDQQITEQGYGKYITSTSSYGNITGNSVIYGPKDGLAGGAAYISSYVSGETIYVPTVTFNNSNIMNNKAVASVDSVYGSSAGGALFIKGSDAVFNDAVFTNNLAESKGAFYAVGGAILADAKVNKGINQQTNIIFNNTKDTVYSGNEVKSADTDNRWYDTYGGLAQTSGGFLFLDRSSNATFNITNGSTLTIGTESATGDTDSIASSIIHSPNVVTSSIEKTCDGTLTINSDFNKYYGTLAITEGTVNLVKQVNLKNSVTVDKNATLNLSNVELTKLSTAVGGTNVNEENNTFQLNGVSANDVNTSKNYTLNDTTGSITADGEVNISDGLNMHEGTSASLNGGGTVSAVAGHNSAVHADNATFTSTDVNFNGVISAKNGATITINGGTVNAIDYYEDGKVDGKTEVNAQGSGSTVTLNNVQVNSHVSAYGGGKVNVNNSNINGYEGMEAFEGGIINLNGSADNTYVAQEYIFVGDENSKIYLKGGTLVAENLRDLLQVDFEEETLTSADKGIVLNNKGVIQTKADQIFANGVDLTSDETVLASKAGDVTNNAIDYKGGTLSLTDEKYSLNYVQSAKESLTKHDNSSKTSIVMTGDLVTAGGVDNTIKVDDAASVGDDIALDKVTVEADNNLLVGAVVSGEQKIENITIKDSVTNGFNAGSLNLADGSTGMVITNDKNVTLGGSEGGSIITVNGAEPTGDGVQVVVGLGGSSVTGVTNEAGSFTIGNALATSETEYTLYGSVTVNADSNLTTNGQTTITAGVTLNNGNLDAASGALNADITAETNTTNTITGTVNVGTLTGAENAVINVGTADKTASTSIEDANLSGATICFDPAWDQEAGTHGIAFVDNGSTADVDGKVLIGRNNYVGVGTADSQAAKEMFAKTGLTFGENDITAALYIAGNQTLDSTNGAIVVDGSKAEAGDFGTVSGGTFTAADNSVTMVDGQSIKDNAALSGVTTATIDDGAKLYIDNAKKGETYKVIAGADAGWADDNIISDNSLLVFAGDTASGDAFNVTASYDKVDNVYGAGAVVIADVVDTVLDKENEGNAAFDFFNAAANSKNNATKAAQVAAFNSAANMGEMGGVNHAAYSVSNAMTDAVADHLSIATHGDHDKDIWAHYVHNKENIEGISLGGLSADYDFQYNGIVVGSDLYKKGKATAGIALSYVDGDVTGSNIASNTKNEAEYYGASVYGRIDNGNSAVIGDITYMHGSNDITQNNSGYKLTADADTDVFSIGVRAEQKVEAGIGQFVPYAGLRYMHIGTGNYTNSIGMSYDVDEQNLWLLPVGVTYSCDAKAGDWTIRPVVEAGYVWAMGDRDTNQTVSLNGAANGFGFDTADSGSFVSRFAVEAEKANVTYSLGYEYQKGDTVKANKWMANLTFSF